MELIRENINPLIGIPYGFRDDPGLDCYQLVVKALNDLFGITAPDYVFHGPEDEAWIAFAANKLNWQPGNRDPGDVVTLKIGRYTHCGLYLGNGEMIHTLRGCQSSIESIDTLKWRDRITGFYKCPNQ